jgi:ATP-binding cassette subfamily G (WHITE) protein 2
MALPCQPLQAPVQHSAPPTNPIPSPLTRSHPPPPAGTYYASAYYLARTVCEIVLQLPSPILFSCVVYWLVGLQPLASKFLIFTGFMVLCSNAATSLAVMVSALCR